jgi:hypothetical protein
MGGFQGDFSSKSANELGAVAIAAAYADRTRASTEAGPNTS